MERGFFIDPRRGHSPEARPDAEAIYSYTANKAKLDSGKLYLPPGWYWRCIDARGKVEGGANGPYHSEQAAVKDCREQHGTDVLEYLELYDARTDLWRERLA